MIQRCRSPTNYKEYASNKLKGVIHLRRCDIEIKQSAKLWAVYELTKDGLELVRKEVIVRGQPGRPICEKNHVAFPIAKGYLVFTMAYDDFIKNAKSEFIKEETKNAD